eukprot:Nk52_evm67s217 gene=Nk52_evmTU67s217
MATIHDSFNVDSKFGENTLSNLGLTTEPLTMDFGTEVRNGYNVMGDIDNENLTSGDLLDEENADGVGESSKPANSSELASEGGEVPTYDDLFPSLPTGQGEMRAAQASEPSGKGLWANAGGKPAIKSSSVTQVFQISLGQQKYGNEKTIGEKSHAQICREVMEKTNTTIDVSISKDQTLTLVVMGKPEMVSKAKKMLLDKFQTRVTLELKIPKEHYKFILGKGGKSLQALAEETSTNIQVPKQDEDSDVIRIAGTVENVEKARLEIQLISDEKAKLSIERLNIPKVYHPFITGPDNENLKKIVGDSNVKVNIPPSHVENDEIIITGERNAVAAATSMVRAMYEDKAKNTKTLVVDVKKEQHKWVIGPKGAHLAEIFRNFGVVVEVPPIEEKKDKITLRGDGKQLAHALGEVLAKANSVVTVAVPAPRQIHKYIIGKKGANIRKISEEHPSVQVLFVNEKECIELQGSPESVEKCKKVIESTVKDMLEAVGFAEINVESKYLKHLIGKNGQNIKKIREETGAFVQFPTEENSTCIKIEGPRDGVDRAKNMLLDEAAKLADMKEKKVTISQRFHKSIIGQNGANVREISDRFGGIHLDIPNVSDNSDVITLKGQKDFVDMCATYLVEHVEDLAFSNYTEEIPVFKKYIPAVFGEHNENIGQLTSGTSVKISVPPKASEDYLVTAFGRKDEVEFVCKKVLEAQSEMCEVMDFKVEIEPKSVVSVEGYKGKLLESIVEECGGVVITLPKDKKSGCVSVRGPREDAEKACKIISEIAKDKTMFSSREEFDVEQRKHLYVRLHKNFGSIKKSTGVRVVFPKSNEMSSKVYMFGKKVAEAAKIFKGIISDMENIETATVNVDPKFHKYFVKSRAKVCNELSNRFGGVTIHFPKPDSEEPGDEVVLKGSRECLNDCIAEIERLVEKQKSAVTVQVPVDAEHVKIIKGQGGSQINKLREQFDCDIQLPSEKGSSKTKNIEITGLQSEIDRCKEALSVLIPVTIELDISHKCHRSIIGNGGFNVRMLKEENNVQIKIPNASEKCNTITVKGAKDDVERVKKLLLEQAESIAKDLKEREERNFKMEVLVDRKFHPNIIGKQGQTINRIRDESGANVKVPSKDKGSDVILIIGYKKNCEYAKEQILELVQEQKNTVVETVDIDPRTHRYHIGKKRSNLKSMQDEYDVIIDFPRAEVGGSKVTVKGQQENVKSAIAFLVEATKGYLEEMEDKDEVFSEPRPQKDDSFTAEAPVNPPSFAGVKNAPWNNPVKKESKKKRNPPSAEDDSAFPVMAGFAPPASTTSSIWVKKPE